MSRTLAVASHAIQPAADAGEVPARVLVACPDARPPAYQAAVGLARSGRLGRFLTAFYHREGCAWELARRAAPSRFAAIDRRLSRRRDAEIPARLVESTPSVDVMLAVENRFGVRYPTLRRAVARHRVTSFDALTARRIERQRPDAVLAFSDVASVDGLDACRRLGIPTVLSMVHGDVREEIAVIEAERERSPDFFPIYLGEAPIDDDELGWLHRRRLRDAEMADRILVPSEHIAAALTRHGTPRAKIAVVPYAADTRRFAPIETKEFGDSCTFLFAGGITQRKGIKYLLEAWRLVRRPGWDPLESTCRHASLSIL